MYEIGACHPARMENNITSLSAGDQTPFTNAATSNAPPSENNINSGSTENNTTSNSQKSNLVGSETVPR